MQFIQGKTEATPAEIGYDPDRLNILNNHLQSEIDGGTIQCAIYCLSRKGKVFAHGALGNRTFRPDSEPAQPDCVRFMASITKTFTAVAIMKLIEDGRTRLDVPVGEILPQFDTPPYNSINLFHLLTHTSGLYPDSGCFENKYQGSYWSLIDTAWQLCPEDKKGEFDWLAAALGTIGNGLRVPASTEWAYCSFGFTVLGAVIEKLSGINAHKYIEDNILKPLGLKDTMYGDTPETAKRTVYTNERHEEELNKIINGQKKESDDIWEKIPPTASGLNSTAYDLTRFGNMMLYKGTFDGIRILGRKSVEKMTTMAIHDTPDYCWCANTPARGYGVGFDMRNGVPFSFSENTFNHEGAGACSLYIDPKEELTASWFVPYVKEGWFPRVMWNVQNIIWSGLI